MIQLSHKYNTGGMEMYHIKNDKRAKTSAKLIYEALLECLNQKPFHEITITDIHKVSSLSRSTFYRNFDSLIDVLKWKSDQSFEKLFNSYIKNINPTKPHQLITFFFNYWFNNSEILEILLHINRQDIIYNSFINKSQIITNYYKEKVSLPINNYDYYIAIRVGIFISILMTWIKNGKKESAQEITKIILEQLEFISQSDVIL